MKLRFFLASLSTFGMVSALQGSPSRLFDFQNGTPEPIVMVLPKTGQGRVIGASDLLVSGRGR